MLGWEQVKLEVAHRTEALRAGLELVLDQCFPPVAHRGHLQSFRTLDAQALPPECWFNWAGALLRPQEFSKALWGVHTCSPCSPGWEQQASRGFHGKWKVGEGRDGLSRADVEDLCNKKLQKSCSGGVDA